MRVWLISVDLPEPLTPVTQIRPPSGMRALTFLRLFSVQPLISMQRRSGSTGRRVSGVGMEYSPVRYLSVVDSVAEPRICRATGPAAGISPGVPRDPRSAAALRAFLRKFVGAGGAPRRSWTV